MRFSGTNSSAVADPVLAAANGKRLVSISMCHQKQAVPEPFRVSEAFD